MLKRAFLNSRRVAAVLLFCPAAASAQIDRKLAALVPSSCIEHLPPSAFKRVVVYAYVDLQDSVSVGFAQSADNFLQELATNTQRQLGASPNRLPVGEPAVNWRGVDVSLHLVAYKDGRIVVVHGDTISAVATAASLVAKTLDGMSTIGQLDWSADSTRDSVRFDVAFVRPVFDSAGHVNMRGHKRDAAAVFSVLAPWEENPAAKPGQTPPLYPAGAQLQGYEGRVVLSFFVDTTGHALISTVHDVWTQEKPRWTRQESSAYQSFLKATEAALANIEFIPARIGGCPVRALVQMPFEYKFR